MPSLVRTLSRIAAAGLVAGLDRALERPGRSHQRCRRSRAGSRADARCEHARAPGRLPHSSGVSSCDRVGDAVVGPVGRDAAAPPGRGAGDAPGDVVRLRARVDEHDRVQRAAGRGDQPLGDLDRRLVQVAHVRVQAPRLADDRLDHARMLVAHDRARCCRRRGSGGRRRRSARRPRHERGGVARGTWAASLPARRTRARRSASAGTDHPSPGSRPPNRRATSSQPTDSNSRRMLKARPRAPCGTASGSSYSAAREAGTTMRGAHPRGEDLAQDAPLLGLERRDLLVAVEQQVARRGRTRRRQSRDPRPS